MTDLVSPAGSIVAVQKFEGLQLEPPKRDIVSINTILLLYS